MTAEVALMNRIGVALAADSAVTIGRDATKIYGSAEKLFQLSNAAPVGVMIYGNAMYQGLPWETAIKAYRSHLGPKTFATVDEYARDLRAFITDNDALFPAKQRLQSTRQLLHALAGSIRTEFQKRLDQEIEARKEVKERELPPIIEAVIRARLDGIRKAQPIDGFSQERLDRLKQEVAVEAKNIQVQVFGTLPFSGQARSDLTDCFSEMLARAYFSPFFVGGVVVAGFGDAQYLPAVSAFEVEEAAAGAPRWRLGSSQVIDSENDSAILAFAQQETVIQFLEGIDPNLREFVRQTSAEVIGRIVATLIDKVREADTEMAVSLESVMKPELSGIINGLHNAWAERRSQQAQPVVGIVATLPKDELASMAESLVNLTKFRRRVTPERETVGGPIDVAVITKGDGFVWIRRKHYFEPALNPRVLAALQSKGVN